MSTCALSWSVELPARGVRSARPRASLCVSSESHGEERLSLPVSVGRRLEALADEGFEPASRAELLHRLGEVSRQCAHARMEAFVGRRDYSCAELTRRLCDDGFTRSVADEIVSRAREVGIVDDARYGAAFARSKALSGWGRVRIERELSRRGVDPASVPGWPEEFLSAEDERERAHSLASRRRLTGKNDYQKLVRFLCSRGFAVSLSTSVAREVLSDHGLEPLGSEV